MNKASKIIFAFPENENLREKHPELKFDDFYGLVDGYSLMFDPVVMAVTQTIPESSNGFPGKVSTDTCVISGCSLTNIPDNNFSGLIVRSGDKISNKEALKLGKQSLTYPAKLDYSTFADSSFRDWTLAGQPVLKQEGRLFTLGIEFFKMLNLFRGDNPEGRLLMMADVFAELLSTTLYKDARNTPAVPDDFRLDCQSYGVNRFLVSWLGELFSETVDFEEADNYFQQAVDKSLKGEMDAAENDLRSAFETLAKIRRSYSNCEFKFIEIPHIGILFEDVGFFEFEWPEFTQMRIEKLLDFTEHTSSKVAFEAGGSCWKHFASRFPDTVKRMNRLREAGKTTVTNGTFSLPFALYSPAGIQYWQLEYGMEEQHKIFGNQLAPVYQCQENSFTPLMPQMFKHFGIESALHVVQNRGHSPDAGKQFFKWRGADGSTIPSMGVRDETLGRKGLNYFYDLPMILKENTELKEIYYPNFQDIGFIPLRTQIYRSTKYAEIWGEFLLPEDLPYEKATIECSFEPEDYCMAESGFYDQDTCINSLSQLERLYKEYNTLRRLQFKSWSAGKLEDNFDSFKKLVPDMLIQEAHDVIACQGQKVGQFYESNAVLESPEEERYLYQKTNDLSNIFDAGIHNIAEEIKNDMPCSNIYFASIEAGIKDNKLQVELAGKIFNIGIFDRKRGDFTLNKVTNKNNQLVVDASLNEKGEILHQAVLKLRYAADLSLLELGIDYSSNAEFSYLDKWKDYLGISVEIEDKLGSLTHCSPGYRTEARKPVIISPYFLSAEAGFSLLNEGAPYYEKLSDNSIAWMFHNYGESVHSRRMAIYLGDADPMKASTSWHFNCRPGCIETELNLPEHFSAEVFIEVDKLLAVSLCDMDISNINNIQIPGHEEKPHKIKAGTLAIFKL